MALNLFGVLVAAHAVVGISNHPVMNKEPHWSFRDGCTAQTAKAPNGNYGYTSYDHCKSLPRVYNGKEWKPTQYPGRESQPTLPSNG